MAQQPHPPEPSKAQSSSQGGMMVTTPMGPQSQQQDQPKGPVPEATEAEQKVGKEAIAKAKERNKEEQEAGKKLSEKAGGGKKPQSNDPQKG